MQLQKIRKQYGILKSSPVQDIWYLARYNCVQVFLYNLMALRNANFNWLHNNGILYPDAKIGIKSSPESGSVLFLLQIIGFYVTFHRFLFFFFNTRLCRLRWQLIFLKPCIVMKHKNRTLHFFFLFILIILYLRTTLTQSPIVVMFSD